MIWYISFLVILFCLFFLVLFKGKEKTPKPEIPLKKKHVYRKTKKPISYLVIVAEVLQHYKELHNPEDIIKRLGAECLVDNIADTKIQLLDKLWSLPEGCDQKVFRFRESVTRDVVLEVVFHKGQLVNFRARMYLYDLDTKRISEFMNAYLRPLISDIIGTQSFRYDSSTDTYYYDNYDGLIIGFRTSAKDLSVTTHIINKFYT